MNILRRNSILFIAILANLFSIYSCSSSKLAAPGPECIKLDFEERDIKLIKEKNRVVHKTRILLKNSFEGYENYISPEDFTDLAYKGNIWGKFNTTIDDDLKRDIKNNIASRKFSYSKTSNTTFEVMEWIELNHNKYTMFNPNELFYHFDKLDIPYSFILPFHSRIRKGLCWNHLSGRYNLSDYLIGHNKLDDPADTSIYTNIWDLEKLLIAYTNNGTIYIKVIDAETAMPIKGTEIIIEEIGPQRQFNIINEIKFSEVYNSIQSSTWFKSNIFLSQNNGWVIGSSFFSNNGISDFHIGIPRVNGKQDYLNILIRANNYKFFKGTVYFENNKMNTYTVKLPRLGTRFQLEISDPVTSTIEKTN